MRVLVIGASGGIGQAILTAYQARGADVLGLSRSGDGLDVTDEDSVAVALGALQPEFDVVLVASGAVATGSPPEKTLRAVGMQGLLAQFMLNAAGPMLVLKHAVRLLPRDRVARLAVLSARVGSIGDNRSGGWYSHRAAKAALNQLVHGASIEVARSHPKAVVALLHPGTVATSMTEGYGAGRDKLAPAVSADRLIGVLEGLGPEQSGGFYDWQGKVVPW